MRANFGTKEVRENDPLLRGFVDHSAPTRALRRLDFLISKVGIGLVQIVDKYYKAYLIKPNDANAKKYLLWRLRLHKKMKGKLEILHEINETMNLGLEDSAPGETCWNMEFD
jgi:hypothetical protein